jgi:hypothetical protein
MNGVYTLSGTPPKIVFPPTLSIGDTWAFDMAAGDYSDPVWIATMTFGSGAIRVVSDATLQQAQFYWLIPASDTATLPVGSVAYTIVVTNASTSERYTLQYGLVTTIPNLADPGTPIGTQTTQQQQLAACDATLLQLLSQRTSSVVFGQKAYTLWDVAKLWEVRRQLAQAVNDEATALDANSRHQIIIPVFKNPWGGPYPSQPFYPYV